MIPGDDDGDGLVTFLIAACILFAILLVLTIVAYGYIRYRTQQRLRRLPSDTHELALQGPIMEVVSYHRSRYSFICRRLLFLFITVICNSNRKTMDIWRRSLAKEISTKNSTNCWIKLMRTNVILAMPSPSTCTTCLEPEISVKSFGVVWTRNQRRCTLYQVTILNPKIS